MDGQTDGTGKRDVYLDMRRERKGIGLPKRKRKTERKGGRERQNTRVGKREDPWLAFSIPFLVSFYIPFSLLPTHLPYLPT